MRGHASAFATLAALALAACNQAPATNPTQTAEPAATELPPPPEEFGAYFARPAELAPVGTDDIVKSMRLTLTAKFVGEAVYNKSCAQCHGADLKGVPDQHTPDLTDSVWRFSGDDAASGGAMILPSDVEWTVRYGIRSGHESARGVEADMVAFDPQYRNEQDTRALGNQRFLTDDELADVVEYVLKISGQEADAAKAARGEELFHNGMKGNCNDCHENGGIGNMAIGSTNLTQKKLYLYGPDRTSIVESITRGRRGVMPAFEGKLRPEEIKAVAIFVYYRAAR